MLNTAGWLKKQLDSPPGACTASNASRLQGRTQTAILHGSSFPAEEGRCQTQQSTWLETLFQCHQSSSAGQESATWDGPVRPETIGEPQLYRLQPWAPVPRLSSAPLPLVDLRLYQYGLPSTSSWDVRTWHTWYWRTSSASYWQPPPEGRSEQFIGIGLYAILTILISEDTSDAIARRHGYHADFSGQADPPGLRALHRSRLSMKRVPTISPGHLSPSPLIRQI